jgi:hypothetical protein
MYDFSLVFISSTVAPCTCPCLLLAVAQTDNSPPATPRPLPGTAVAAATFHSPELLVFALGQTDYDVGFDGAERQDAQPGARTKRADGFGKGSGGVPESL